MTKTNANAPCTLEYEGPKLQKVGSASQVVQGWEGAGGDIADEFLVPGGPFLPDQESHLSH